MSVGLYNLKQKKNDPAKKQCESAWKLSKTTDISI